MTTTRNLCEQCLGELTSTDFECGRCTQCDYELVGNKQEAKEMGETKDGVLNRRWRALAGPPEYARVVVGENQVMTSTDSKPLTYKTEIGWCRSHEGMHSRRADCSDWMYSQPLIGCDAHGKRPHRQSDSCVNLSKDKADPFYGF